MPHAYHKVPIGGVFGAMTVVATVREGKSTRYIVRCTCGAERKVGLGSLHHGSLCASCGCKAREAKRRVAEPTSKSRLYRIYRNMLRRCNDTFNSNYRWYGAKGIKVAFGGFKAFRAWANANGYAEDLTIERRNSSKDYEPSNCEWITSDENRKRAHDLWRKQTHFPIEMFWGAC